MRKIERSDGIKKNCEKEKHLSDLGYDVDGIKCLFEFVSGAILQNEQNCFKSTITEGW